MSLNMVRIIERKRDGAALSTEEINWFISGVTRDEIPDYQVAALLMAIFLQGMNRRETVELTLAMARSGDELDLHDVAPFVVDKHSSGGVGDKTTLVVQPLAAACGVPVGKMSGRGLGSSGGTLDKMESIRGWSPDVSLARFKQQLADIGLVLAGQTTVLAPADGKLYALRDVTGTVSSLPLIAASIMSKKLAGGADAIVLDVKLGSGAFVPDETTARELAQTMVDIGVDSGRKVTALLSDMNQPLGHAVGNALEVAEAIATLQGGGPADFWEHCLAVTAHMLLLSAKAEDEQQARELVSQARQNGRALQKFRDMVTAQGGNGRQVDAPQSLPRAAVLHMVEAPQEGYVAAMDTGALGWAAVNLGAGRQKKGQAIDHAVGFVLPVKVGDRLHRGQPLATVHAQTEQQAQRAEQEILAALSWSQEQVAPLPHFYGTIQGG